MPTAETIRIAREYQDSRAKTALTEAQAKLYSQSMRRQMGREGLATFGPLDINRALEEAFLLSSTLSSLGLQARMVPVWRPLSALPKFWNGYRRRIFDRSALRYICCRQEPTNLQAIRPWRLVS